MWKPQFFDYLYLAFTNATAFSPADVMPLSRWAKALMMAQALVSLITIAIVLARAISLIRLAPNQGVAGGVVGRSMAVSEPEPANRAGMM